MEGLRRGFFCDTIYLFRDSCCLKKWISLKRKQFEVVIMNWLLIFVDHVLFIFLVFCVLFLCFVIVLCLVYLMLPVSVNCQFLIAPSVFSNIYLDIRILTACKHVPCYQDLVEIYSVSAETMINDAFSYSENV
jgi:hypothetical protein